MVNMDINDQVKNYSKCPLKKRPVLIDHEEQCEPENLSTKPEDLSRKSSPYVIQPKVQKPDHRASPIEVPSTTTPTLKPDIQIKEETDISAPIYYPEIVEPIFKPWVSPLTPPSYFPATPNENIDPAYYPPPQYSNKFESQYRYSKEDSLYKTNVPMYNPYTTSSLDLRTNFNNNIIIKPEAYPKRFTPYRVDQHRPLFNLFPLSPASSQASSYHSYESPRRSVSPVSTNSSLSENLPSNYSVFRDLSSMSLEQKQQQQHQKSKPEKLSTTKSAHYQCPDCSKSYSTHSGLSKHLQFHCPAVEGNQAKKNFSCKLCDKVYTSLGALKMHIRTHTLPCKCDICHKAFSRPWLLQGHIRTHTGEKPFSCQHCHRAFADRSNLRAHLQTHSEIKKYSCTTCSKTFSRMSLLTKHIEVGCPGVPIERGTGYGLNQIVPQNNDIQVY